MAERKGFWHNLREKRKRMGVERVPKKSRTMSDKEYKKTIKNIKDSEK